MGLIRFYLAVSVAIWHISDTSLMINGYLAVICFYMISGYYMSMVLNESYRGPGSTFRFYVARYLRLFPTYFVVALFSILFFARFDPSGLLSPQDLPLPSFAAAPFRWLFAIFSNASMLGLDALRLITLHDSNLSITSSLPRVVSQAWSLGIELLFYLAAPFMVRLPLKFAAAGLVACLAIQFSLLPFDYSVWRYYFTPSVFCFFLMGHMSHRLGALISDEKLKQRIGMMSLFVLPFAGYFAGVHVTRDIDLPESWLFMLLFAAILPFIFSLTRTSRINSLIGNLSYPLYLIHRLIYAAIAVLVSGQSDILTLGIGWALFALGSAVLGSIVLHLVVEKRVEAFRQRFKAPVAHPAYRI